MTLTVAVQMDPIQRIKITGDSTFAMLLEAQRRGYRLLHYTPDRLVHARRHRDGDGGADRGPRHRRRPRHHGRARADRSLRPSTWCCCARTRPSTWPTSPPPICSSASTRGPSWSTIRPMCATRPRSCSSPNIPHLMPPTLISRDKAEIEAFRREHGEVVMKPLYGNGGAAVFKVSREDPNFGSLFDLFSVTFREPWVIQRFLPKITEGDKRIILIDGEGGGRDQPRSGAERHPLQHGARRRRQAHRPHAARDRDLRDDRPEAEGNGPDLRRHRRDRRQPHRDQRDVPDRPARHQAPRRSGHRRDPVGRDRGEGWARPRVPRSRRSGPESPRG